MLSRLLALLCLAAALSFASPAFAQAAPKIAVVDFQEAVNQVKDGATARTNLEAMYKQKKIAIEAMEKQLMTMKAEYDKQALILSDAARQQKERELMTAQQNYQQAYMQHEQEMQTAYANAMEGLIEKMKTICEQIGTEKGYTLILEINEGGVVFSASSIDITAELIKRYDAAAGK